MKQLGMAVVAIAATLLVCMQLLAEDRGEPNQRQAVEKVGAVKKDGAGKNVRVTFTACIEDCESAGCLQTCVDDNRGPARDVSLEQWRMSEVQEALDNIRFCESRYLNVEYGAIDEESFDTCSSAAAKAYVYKAAEIYDDTRYLDEIEVDVVGSGLAIVARVSQIARAAAVDAAMSRAVGGVAGTGDNGTTPKPNFKQCIIDYDDNKAFCDGRYPDGSTELVECFAAAQTGLEGCLKKIY